MARSLKNSSRGTRYAKQFIFYAGKWRLMTTSDLRKIGSSVHVNEILSAISREAHKEMRPVLQAALKMCDEGDSETVQAKKDRKRAARARIEQNNKKNKHNARPRRDRYNSEVREYVPRALDIGLSSAHRDDIGIPLDTSSTLTDIASTIAAAGREVEAERATPDASIAGETPEDFEETSDDVVPAKINRQLALVRGEPLRVDDEHCRITIAGWFTSNRDFDVDSEFEAVLTNCIIKLDPEAVKEDTVEYLDNRLATTSTINPPMASASSTTEEILDVLQILSRLSEDAIIRSAAAQILLYLSVKREAVENREDANGIHRKAELNFLQALAAKKAGAVSEKESAKIYRSYKKDYYSGKRWLDIVDMFGGDGIVVLFVIAGIGPWYVTHKFTEYQRVCLRHCSSHLYGIKNLVTALGPDALERYCRRGCFSRDTIARFDATDIF